jgi:GNAT superfamily N-acetyltransferase
MIPKTQTDHLCSFRKAKISEAKALSLLAIRSKAHWGYSKEFMENCREELTVTVDDLKSGDSQFYVAELDSNILGFYGIEPINDVQFELDALFVDSHAIGKGIGKLLLNHASTQIKKRGGKEMIIQGDPHAEKFYRASGAKRIGEKESGSIPGRYLPMFKIDLLVNNKHVK